MLTLSIKNVKCDFPSFAKYDQSSGIQKIWIFPKQKPQNDITQQKQACWSLLPSSCAPVSSIRSTTTSLSISSQFVRNVEKHQIYKHTKTCRHTQDIPANTLDWLPSSSSLFSEACWAFYSTLHTHKYTEHAAFSIARASSLAPLTHTYCALHVCVCVCAFLPFSRISSKIHDLKREILRKTTRYKISVYFDGQIVGCMKKIYFDMKFHVPFKLATDFKICISKLGCFDGNSLIRRWFCHPHVRPYLWHSKHYLGAHKQSEPLPSVYWG